jgi:hypothetical protein
MSCHSETGRAGIHCCIDINQRLHFGFTLPYQNPYFDTRPSPMGEVIRLPDLSCVETNYFLRHRRTPPSIMLSIDMFTPPLPSAKIAASSAEQRQGAAIWHK